MLNNQDFTHNRVNFLGGSDIGAIIGVSKYRSALDVWFEKTGKHVDAKDSLALRFGSFAEDFIASEYARHIALPVVAHANPIIHGNYSYLAGHIDRFVLPDSSTALFDDSGILQASKLLECKTASGFTQREWGEAGTDEIPLQYLTQCLWYLELTQLPSIDLAVLIGGSDFRIYTVEADRPLQQLLVEKAVHFWSEYVVKDCPPPPESESDCQALFARSIPSKAIEASEAIRALIAELQVLEHNITHEEERISAIKQTIMQTMADAETLTIKGKPIITWKAPKPTTRIDTKRLSSEHPEFVKPYQITTDSARRFVLKDWDIEASVQEAPIITTSETLV